MTSAACPGIAVLAAKSDTAEARDNISWIWHFVFMLLLDFSFGLDFLDHLPMTVATLASSKFFKSKKILD
jgi:hypothetical protein